MESGSLILLAVATLAVGALISPKPSLSATLLFLESILINVVIIFNTEDISMVSAAILLSFFIMITIGANYYLEMSDSAKFKPSKLGMFIGAFSLFFFWKYLGQFTISKIPANNELMFKPDFIEILIIGFTLFSILVSTITILCMKNPKRRSSL